MNCLWLTWTDPSAADSGELIYSKHLIEAVAAAGVALDVLCLAEAQEPPAAQAGVRWRLVRDPPRGALASLLTPWPNVAARGATAGMQAALAQALDERRWDCIALDGIFAGWALGTVLQELRHHRPRPRLVYVAHNHEASLRRQVARNYQGAPARRLAMRFDAAKAALLERRVVQAADVLTAITPEDAAAFQQAAPHKPVVVLSPGYAGRRRPERPLDASTPRRAILVGSFDWIAKRMNLEEFLAVADPMFAAQGAELLVVGRGDGEFIAGLQRRLRATTLTGSVPSTYPYLDTARLALVPERTGGGFKLKVLEYVFNGLPVAALDASIAGTPLVPGESVLTYADHAALAQGALAQLDDLTSLERLRRRAYAACATQFDWAARGRAFLAAVAA